MVFSVSQALPVMHAVADPSGRQIVGTRARTLLLATVTLTLAEAALAVNDPGQIRLVSPLTKTDVSPDGAIGSLGEGGADPGGRVVSLALDPRDQNLLYAASEHAGIWKSTDGGLHWQESNSGLRSSSSVPHRQAVALDDRNPDRLLYLIQDDDHRIGKPLGGLWTSVDGSANWVHVTLPGCQPPNLSGAVFVRGQPFVLTRCGIATSTAADFASASWTYLQNLPFPAQGYAVASLPNSESLFACQGAKVYRSLSRGAAGSWKMAALPGGCLSLAVLPDNDKRVIVQYALSAPAAQGVSVFDVDAAVPRILDIGAPIVLSADGCDGTGGSGAAGLFPVRRLDLPPHQGPGLSYEVFVSTGCSFYHFTLVSASAGDWTRIPNVHDDSWAMAITPSYEADLKQRCTAYLSTDGGVFRHTAGCDLNTGWQRSMSGLHVMYSQTMAGISTPQSQCPDPGQPCPALYLPTGDNDVWVSTRGGLPGTSWSELGTRLGDAAIVLNDPALPGRVMASRGGGFHQYLIVASSDGKPPGPGATATDIQPPNPSPGGAPPAMANLVQVMTLAGESPNPSGDYLAVSSPGADGSSDRVLRNTEGNPGAWVDLSPTDPFGPGQVAGIAASGGHAHTVVYVLTSPNATNYDKPPLGRGPGHVWKGIVVNGVVTHWTKVSTGIGKAFNLSVNPYDPNVAYVSDLGDLTIKVTSDGGASWQVERTLTDVATNFGEFVFDCGQPARSGGQERGNPYNSVLAFSCPLQQVVFDRDHRNFRVAALLFGGVLLSRNAGHDWIPLLVTNDDFLDNGPP